MGDVECYREYDMNEAVVLERWTLQVEGIAQVDSLTKENRHIITIAVPVVRYQYRDHLGSSVVESNELGQVISYEEYYPYGVSAYQVSSSSADLLLKRYRFTGKERDEETGLDYFGVRYYASWLGRWTSGDPEGFVDGLNLYRYVRNNPVNGVDREGYSTEDVGDPKPPPVKKKQEPTNALGDAANEVVVTASKEKDSGIIYGNEHARKDVLKRTSKKNVLTKGMWIGHTPKQRKEKGWNKNQIGSEVDNPFYNEEFAKYIAHLDSLEEIFVLSYLGTGVEKITDGEGNEHRGGFYATQEVGKFVINYGEQGKEYGGNRYHALFEEIHHAYSFTQGNFRMSTADEKGKFRAGNYDVYDELDAKIFSLQAGNYSKLYERVIERSGKIITLNIPTDLGILASNKLSLEEKAKYLISGIKKKVYGTLGESIITTDVPLGGMYKPYFPGEENKTKRLYNEEKEKVMTKQMQAYPHKR